MTTLKRTLGFGDLALLIVGSVIGSGIFLVPGAVLGQVQGRIAPALLVWLAGGVLSLLGALTYGELSARNPEAGGLYVYIRDCFGRLPAFLFGWALFFAIGSGATATLAVAFSHNLGEVIPMTPIVAKLVAIAMIAVVAAVNVLGTRRSADLQNWTTAIKVGAILFLSGALLLYGRGFAGSGAALWPEQLDRPLVSGFGVAMIGVLWAYEGWQYCTFTAGETIDAQRNFPRAFMTGTAILIGVYLLANVGYLAALTPDELMNTKSAAASAAAMVAGPAASKMIAIAIAISIFSAANSLLLTTPRVYYAMANDGLFFRRLAYVHPRFGTPAFAIIAGSIWASALTALAEFQQLLTYVVFSGWIFYALAAASIFVYRRRRPNAARAYRVPGYPWTPLAFIVAAAALVLNTIIARPYDAAVGVGIVSFGAPVYLFWRARSRKALAAEGDF